MDKINYIPISERQRLMHKDFFDRIKHSMECKFYLESIFLEYSALESRLETIMGLLSLPCNKELADNKRTSINISNRIDCLKKHYATKKDIFVSSKLDKKFFEALSSWIRKRNGYIHGLYKSVEKYNGRLSKAKNLAQEGFEFVNLIYNETNRLRNQQKKSGFAFASELCKKNCN